MSNSERMNSITDATGSLVELLDKLEGVNASQTHETQKNTDVFKFGNKDLILYALGGRFNEF